MTDFCACPEKYTAPYTCIVSSSLMGKSRLMKEVATRIPTVYMCLGTDQTFYPHPTKVVVEWIRDCVERTRYWNPSDKDFLLLTLKYSAFLLALIQQLPDLVRKHSDEKDYSWMWTFFAEPSNDYKEINEFWVQVTDQATAILRAKSSSNDGLSQKLSSSEKHSTSQKSSMPQAPSISQRLSSSQKPSTPRSPSSSQHVIVGTLSTESARTYLQEEFGADLRDAYNKLKKVFNIIVDKDFSMLFIFDEARYLTDTSAIDGKRIPADYKAELGTKNEKKASE